MIVALGIEYDGSEFSGWQVQPDQPTVQAALERALAAYPGALLLVSHDRMFLEGCTNAIWEVRNGSVTPR